MRQVAAVILAAGEAKRFRCPAAGTKLAAELNGKPLIRHVADAALASRAHPVLLVTGHGCGHVLHALDGLLLERVHNCDPGAGLSSSLKLAIAALPKAADGAIILLGDMPLISKALIDRLIEAFDKAPAGLLAVVPVHEGRRGNPALIGRGLFASMMALEGDRGAGCLIGARAPVVEVPVEDRAIEIDVDTWDDLRLLRELRAL